jgi:putative membrane protein
MSESVERGNGAGEGQRGIEPVVMLRCALGGVLMGLANLVPGISGGTMLLASGVYRRFINAIADVTRLRFSLGALATLGVIVGAAMAAVVLGAGIVKWLVVEHRWVMYALFIGLTLGGVPIVWRLARPATVATWVGAALGFAALGGIAGAGWMGYEPGGGGSASMWLFVVGGAAAAGAMILPGVSGGYLLLVLGLYVPILTSIDRVKVGISERDIGILLGEWRVVVPVGVGVVLGVVVISNVLRWLLRAHEKPTLGALLGLLVGAVVGLWPFQASIEPQVGDVLKGQAVVAVEERPDDDGNVRRVAVTAIDEIEREDWKTGVFTPNAVQVVGAIGLILVGFVLTQVVARVGDERDGAGAESSPGAAA